MNCFPWLLELLGTVFEYSQRIASRISPYRKDDDSQKLQLPHYTVPQEPQLTYPGRHCQGSSSHSPLELQQTGLCLSRSPAYSDVSQSTPSTTVQSNVMIGI